MATYTKPLKTLDITTINGYSASAQDTAGGSRDGSYAIEAFEKRETIKAHIEEEEMDVLIPYHAIVTACESTSTGSAFKSDPYGCEDNGTVFANLTGQEAEIAVYQNGTKQEDEGTTDKTYAEWLDLFTNHADYSVKVVTGCGEFEAEYSGEGNVASYVAEGDSFDVRIYNYADENYISISGELDRNCLPVQVMVKKK